MGSHIGAYIEYRNMAQKAGMYIELSAIKPVTTCVL